MGEAIREGTYANIQILAPFVEIDKAEIVRQGVKLGVDYLETYSCYKGAEKHCGRCGTCVERREAFLLAGVPDPTEYEHTDPLPPAPAASSSATA
jgi:7-cyano-7-deazaguanine synthase